MSEISETNLVWDDVDKHGGRLTDDPELSDEDRRRFEVFANLCRRVGQREGGEAERTKLAAKLKSIVSGLECE